MIVLIDIGNSRLKWATLKPSTNKRKKEPVLKVESQEPIMYTDNDYEDVVDSLMDLWAEQEITPSRVIAASVFDQELSEELENAIWYDFEIELEYLKTSRKFKQLKNGYTKPSQLGVDRWLSLIGAYSLVSQDSSSKAKNSAFCVIDCGTAITLDIVANNSRHLGGFIIPGFHLMQSSLLENTSAIKESIKAKVLTKSVESLPDYNDNTSLAKDTFHAVNAGIHYAIISYLERIIEDFTSQLNDACKIYITGGDADKLAPLLNIKQFDNVSDMEVCDDLIWQGMGNLVL